MPSTTHIYTIYQIFNKVNQKVYIGITTKDPEYRWNQHKKLYQRKDFVLYKAMRKYGLENFEFSILEQTDNIETLKELEIKYIEKYNSYCFQEESNGYNMTLGGEGINGYKHSKETIETCFLGNKNPMYGKHISEEHKIKISSANKNKKLSHTHRKKISKARIGIKLSDSHKQNIKKSKSGENNYNFGKKLSEETKKKISKALKNNQNGRHNLGKKRTEESKKRMSEARKKYLATLDETKCVSE